VAFLLQPLPVNPLQSRRTTGQGLIDHAVVGFGQVIFLEPHPLSEGAEQIDIGLTLAERLDGLIRYLEVVVAVGLNQVLVFEEGGRGQDDIGIIGGIRKETARGPP